MNDIRSLAQRDGLSDALILIADDEEANVDLLYQMLARAGFRNVIGTSDPREVIPLFRARQPDLLLLDLLMPYVDGFAIMAELAELLPPDAFLPVIVLTADITAQTRERALAAGACDFLTKPFDPTELVLRIRNLLRTRSLTMRLQRQNQTLERLYHEAQQALNLRDQMLSVITHDLGQPIVSIKLTARGLRQAAERGTLDRGRLTDELITIEDTAEQMSAMIGELLDVARVHTGRELELHVRPTDLVALAHQMARAYRKVAERHAIRVEAAVPTLVGEWDDIRLQRVIANLLSNAIKYSPEGGTITIGVRPRQDEHGRWAELTVVDEGIGIPEADLPFIFERFHRGGNVIGRIRGTGVGLSSAQAIIAQHRGTIAVSSIEGTGTTVTIRLPLR